jgi:hypothetical protein
MMMTMLNSSTPTLSVEDILAAIGVPGDARLDQRIPKKMLLEQATAQGLVTAADKRQVRDSLEELRWLATLKPKNCAIAAFKDSTHEYLEIAILSIAIRPDAKSNRLAQLIHRAIPYPVFLVLETKNGETSDGLSISLAHKRLSLAEGDKTVLEESRTASLSQCSHTDRKQSPLVPALLASLALKHASRSPGLALESQSFPTMFSVYQFWLDCLAARKVAEFTGSFDLPESGVTAANQRIALDALARLEREEAVVRAKLRGQKQLSRRVELNSALKRIQMQRSGIVSSLRPGQSSSASVAPAS